MNRSRWPSPRSSSPPFSGTTRRASGTGSGRPKNLSRLSPNTWRAPPIPQVHGANARRLIMFWTAHLGFGSAEPRHNPRQHGIVHLSESLVHGDLIELRGEAPAEERHPDRSSGFGDDPHVLVVEPRA